MMLFETERLVVRRFTAADLDDFYLLSSDPVIMQYIRAPMSRDACRELLDELMAAYQLAPQFGRFAVIEKQGQQYIGHFLLRPSSFRNSTETGYAFFQQAWNKGYATEITKGGIQFAFTHLQLKTLFAITETPNLASQKVLLKCGFVQSSSFIENGKELYLFELTNTTG